MDPPLTAPREGPGRHLLKETANAPTQDACCPSSQAHGRGPASLPGNWRQVATALGPRYLERAIPPIAAGLLDLLSASPPREVSIARKCRCGHPMPTSRLFCREACDPTSGRAAPNVNALSVQKDH